MWSLSCYWWIARSQATRQITTLPLSALHFESRNELTKLSLHSSSLKRSFLSVLFGTKHPLIRKSNVIFLLLRGTYKNAKYLMVCGFLSFNVIFRVLVVLHWWAFGAVDFLQLYAISELFLMAGHNRTKSGNKRSLTFGVRFCFLAGSQNSDQVLSLIRVILFCVCVRKDCEICQFKPSFID